MELRKASVREKVLTWVRAILVSGNGVETALSPRPIDSVSVDEVEDPRTLWP
jgi:hypothetical protein